MQKFLVSFSIIAFPLFFALFSESKRETHSLFYISRNNASKTTEDSIYEIVKQDGAFGSAPAFYLIEKFGFIKSKISTGEYEVRQGESAISVIMKMIFGKKIIRKLTIPEGYTVKRILEIIEGNALLFGGIDGDFSEASLAPNTYFYSFGDTKNSVLQKMKNQMKIVEAKFAPMNKTPLTFKEIIILASVIEKESGHRSELSLISSVFHNRLAIKMRLQSDPTVIYALTNGYGKMDRLLTRKDLWFQSPYNTYRNAGLPPNAICCPGEEAILAAMNPARTNFYYFVAKKDRKGHIFSESYAEHLKEVKRLRAE